MPKDALQSEFVVGELVNVPCLVTAVGGTPQRPTVTLSTKYFGFDGAVDVVGPIDAIQVIKQN